MEHMQGQTDFARRCVGLITILTMNRIEVNSSDVNMLGVSSKPDYVMMNAT